MCSPLTLYYRDTSTILFRLQQHARKIVPEVLAHQTTCLAHARQAQRESLDVADSLAMIDTLNGPVRKAFDDIQRRAQKVAHDLAEERRRAETRRARKDDERLMAESSLPTTPTKEREADTPAAPTTTTTTDGAATATGGDAALVLVGGVVTS